MKIILLIAKIICAFIPLIWLTLFTIFEKNGWCEKWWGFEPCADSFGNRRCLLRSLI